MMRDTQTRSMSLVMSDRIERALAGEAVVFSSVGGLPAGVDAIDLTSAITAAGRDAGLTGIEADVLYFLVVAAWRAGWRGAAVMTGEVRLPATWMGEHFRVGREQIFEAERSLADKGWIALVPGAAEGEVAVHLQPLLDNWEGLCRLMVANLAATRAARFLRQAVAWRTAGLARECAPEEEPGLPYSATLAERAAECDRLLLALEGLVAAPAKALDDTLRQGE